MSQREFTKEDFVLATDGRYQIEYQKGEIGEGVNLVVEKSDSGGEYEVLQVEIKRFEDRIFIIWSEPFNGRLIFED